MEDLSEEAIRKNCPHCSIDSQAYFSPLEETKNFHIICDAHPLEEGHILVIPKAHVSCIGVYDPALLAEFKEIHDQVSKFVLTTYGSVATFEHGVFGQTVFHSHIHYLPFTGSSEEIVPEGKDNCMQLNDLSGLQQLFQKEGGYLFFSIGDNMWTVNAELTKPRFFRDRFAIALGHPERGSWKDMHHDAEVMKVVEQENQNVQKAWKNKPL
jgi:diadenosine tetraphosphate (Ap4A) HIT family hydrolase